MLVCKTLQASHGFVLNIVAVRSRIFRITRSIGTFGDNPALSRSLTGPCIDPILGPDGDTVLLCTGAYPVGRLRCTQAAAAGRRHNYTARSRPPRYPLDYA